MAEKEFIHLNFAPEELRPLRDRIAASIRDSIIEGKIRPGERLLEPDVANVLGVSRTPLREAFLQLESEGFLKVNPRKGALVTATSPEDAKETYVIKGALEALAAKLACMNITVPQITELECINDTMASIAQSEKKDYKAFLELNSLFHQKMYECCGNDKLKRMIKTLRNQTLRYNYIFLSLLSHLEQSVSEHREILNALQGGGQDSVETAVKRHNDSALTLLIEYINNQKKS